ncbi:hypothetical protein Pfo_002677 [Paulownia fortunei]|nr:hypothetical protein Pfo_002677 [Paulownia fortunei]
MATANSSEILHNFYPMVRVFKDGRVEKLLPNEFVPPSLDPDTGVQSKDVEISPEDNVSARLYLPQYAAPGHKLPILVYFHGGGFMVGSPFSQLHHKHLISLVAKANVVAVSVDYRLAPEHPLPIGYEDSWLALKWVASQSTNEGHEEWIKEYGDLDRVYLGGDSAGGNIAHNMAIRVGSEKMDGINLRGVFLNCPFFWGEDPIGNEAILYPNRFESELWHYVCPSTTGCDDPRANPAMDPKLSCLGCKRVLIYVAEKDVLRDRGWYYKEVLSKSGWDGEVEVVDVKGERHVFSVLQPNGQNAMDMLNQVAVFLNH